MYQDVTNDKKDINFDKSYSFLNYELSFIGSSAISEMLEILL